MSAERITQRIHDRSAWPPGPWDDEPDRIEWLDDSTGLHCLMLRSRIGAWCGYVAVPNGHPWHDRGYDDVEADVHGGLTYAEHCRSDILEGEEVGICHAAEDRRSKVRWFGFDCAHWQDRTPFVDGVYRDVGYVRKEVLSLAQQAANALLARIRDEAGR
jgi:hypothetical protein